MRLKPNKKHIIFIHEHATIKLTERQYAILKLIVHGFANRQIAIMLNLRERAIEKDRAKLIHIFNVHNSIELAAITLEHEIISYEPDRYQWLWQLMDSNQKRNAPGML